MNSTVFLMYHELQVEGRLLCSNDPGYVRYVVDVSVFRAHLDQIAARGLSARSVTEWADGSRSGSNDVVMTFDDGCESDLVLAAPLLRERGFNATCFLTVDYLDRPGFLSAVQVRELASIGIEIGCHSMSHTFLDDVDDAALVHEVVHAKRRLEDLCDTTVRTFSCPGGRYDERLVPLARDAGFETICGSRPVTNQWPASSEVLGRVAVTRDVGPDRFAGFLDGSALGRSQIAEMALRCAKNLLGNRRYERIRARLLK